MSVNSYRNNGDDQSQGGPSTVVSPSNSVDKLPLGPMIMRTDVNASPATAIAIDAPDLAVEVRSIEILELPNNLNETSASSVSSSVPGPAKIVAHHDVPTKGTVNKAVEFTEVDHKHTYRAYIAVINRGAVAQRIRVALPSTRAFTVQFHPTGPIARGMEIIFSVMFRIPETALPNTDQFTDTVMVRAESGSNVALPLRAFTPLPKLEYSPLINFGPIVLGGTAPIVRSFDIVNRSYERGASISISVKTAASMTKPGLASVTPSLPITVHPTRALLAPVGIEGKPNNVTVQVTVNTSSLDTGSYRGIIQLDGPGIGSRVIDVVAEIVDHAVSIVYTDGSGMVSDTIDFGSIFFGQRQNIQAVVINHGPKPVSFQLLTGSAALSALDENDDLDTSSYRDGGRGLTNSVSGHSKQSSSITGSLNDTPSPTGDPILDAAFEKDFRIAPTQGNLGPYEELPITLAYNATDRRPAPLFRAQATKEQEEKLREQAGLPPSPPLKLPGLGKYPQRRSPHRNEVTNDTDDHSSGNEEKKDEDWQKTQKSSATRGRSMGVTSPRKPLPVPQKARSQSPHKRTSGKMTVAEIVATYSRAAPPLEIFTSRFALVVPELRQTTGFDVIGRAVRPVVSVSVSHIDFGKVLVNGRADAEILLRNDSELLPIIWSTEKVPNYFTTPLSGKLAPLSETKIIVSFIPTRLGPANEAIPIVIRPGNGLNMIEPSKYILREPTGEPVQKGAKNGRIVAAVDDSRNLLVVPLALTALSIAPALPNLPGSMDLHNGYTPATGGIGVGLASQFSPPGHLLPKGGIIGGGTAITLGDHEGMPVPPGTVGPTGSISSSIATPFDGSASVTGTAAIAALSNATGPNAMPSVFRRSGLLAERHADMPPHFLEVERHFVDQVATAHTHANVTKASGNALFIASDTNAIEVAEEKDRTQIRGQETATHHHSEAWLQTATHRGLRPDEYATDPRYTYNVAELQAKHAHKTVYNDYVADQTAKRKQAKLLALLTKRGNALPHWDDPVSAGMEDGKLALREPTLHIPDASKEALWLANPKGPDGRPLLREHGSGAAAHRLNPDKLIKIKFKPNPTTQAERVDCSLLLSDEELAAVICGPAIINIGDVNVHETGMKSFGVFNGLPSSILVTLQLPPGVPELQYTAPLAQVVPPGATAGFDMTFYAEEENEFKVPITYVINGKHASRFTVIAKAVPIEILLSKTDLMLKFSEESLESYITETIRMSNPGKSDAEFIWKPRDTDAPFEIEPVSGVLLPGESSTALITYRPAYKCLTETLFTLFVRGGRTGPDAPTLITTGESIDARVSFVDRMVDFGRLGVGLKVSQIVPLKNTGSSIAVFYISTNLPKGVTVFPMKGKIDPMDTIDLKISVLSNRPCILDPTQAGISLTVRGGKSCYLPLSAIVIMPDICVMEEEINFGGVTIGNKARRHLTIVNRSPIYCELSVNFANQPRFSIRPPKKDRNMNGGAIDDDDEETLGEQSIFRFDDDSDELKDDEEENDATRRNGSSTGTKDISKSEKSMQKKEDTAEGDDEKEENKNSSDEDDEGEDDEDEDGPKFPPKFRVKLAPESTLPFDLIFRPRDVGPVSFPLPVTVAGVSTLPDLQRNIVATGLAPRIKVESLVVDFEQRTWQKNPERRLPHILRFKIYNTDTADVAWRADVSNLMPYYPEGSKPAFTFEPESGIVPVGDTFEVTVSFTPQEAREYVNTVPIFLEGSDNDGAPYLEMEFRGKGVPPSLAFDRHEFVLPPVPLGAVATGTFYILNHGYDHCDLKFRVPSNEITSAVNVPVRVLFPEGETVSLSKARLPVMVEVRSDKALAFTSLIEFMDEDGQRYSIPVSGICDNSLLTSYSYIDNHRNELYLEAVPEKSPSLVSSARQTDNGVPAKGHHPGKPNAPHAPAFPSKETLNKAAAMIPPPGSVPPNLPVALAETDLPNSVPTNVSAFSASNYAGLVKWLNTCALRQPIHNWPEDIVQANGKPILDMVEALSGQLIPGRLKGKPPSQHKERIIRYFKQASEFLTFLKVAGAFVHDVRAENLLDQESFCYVRKYMHHGWFGVPFGAPQEELFKSSERKAREQKVKESYPALSLAAWTSVTLQAIRIFSLSRVTLRALVNTAGMYMDKESQTLWDDLLKKEAEITSRIAASKQVANSAKGVSLAERPSVGATVKRVPGGNHSLPHGNTLDAGNSLMQEFHGPKPTAGVEPSVILDNGPVTTPTARGTGRSNTTSNNDPHTIDTSIVSVPLPAPDTSRTTDSALLAEQKAAKKAIADFLGLDPGLDGSNILSSPELILLRWIGYHYNRVNTTNKRRFVDFGGDFTDGATLIYVLLSHVPELGKPGRVLDLHSGNVHSNPVTPKQMYDNATAIVKALHELGLNPPFSAEDIYPDYHGTATDESNRGLGFEGGNNDTTSLLDSQMALLKSTISLPNDTNTKSSVTSKKDVPNSAATVTSKSKKGVTAPILPSPTVGEKKPHPSRPLFTTDPLPSIANRLPGTNRVRAGNAHARDWVLWIMWLWSALPQQIPRTCIDFKGPLGSRLRKSVVLTNPTKKAIIYTVTMEGATCFDSETTNSDANSKDRSVRTIKLEAQSTITYGVTCHTRFSRAAHGKLVFRSKSEGITAPSILIFALRTIVTSRPPLQIKTVTGKLYSVTKVDIEVKNTTNKEGEFTIQLLHTDPNGPNGNNISPEHIQAIINDHGSEYTIGSDGKLPYYLAPDYVPPPKPADDISNRLSHMSIDDLAMYGLTMDDAAAIMANSAPPEATDNNEGKQPSTGNTHPGIVTAENLANAFQNDGGLPSSRSRSSNSAALVTGTETPIGEELTPIQAGSVGRGKTHSLPDPFWCRYSSMNIKPGHTKRLSIQFMPFKSGLHRAAIVVVDRHSEIMEIVYEINGTAEMPLSHNAKLYSRTQVAKTIERLLVIPALNASKEYAYDSTIDRLDRRQRAGELAAREIQRSEEAVLREKALAGVRKVTLSGGKGMNAKQKQALKTAAAIMLGTFYDVTVDSPFFEVPKRVYVPFPSKALPGSGAAGSVRPNERRNSHGYGSIHSGGTDNHSNKDGSIPSDSHGPLLANDMTASVVALIQPALETLTVPIAPFAGTHATTTTETPSQASIEIPADTNATAYRPLVGTVQVADALASNRPDLLNLLSRVPFVCRPKGAGAYAARITLTSDRDTRVYEVELIVETPSPVRQVIFQTPVDKPITQKLPITNPTAHDIVFNVTMKPFRQDLDASKLHFTVDPSIAIPANSTADLSVTFNPEFMGDELVTLSLTESGTATPTTVKAGDQAPELPVRLTYDLRGMADEPLALDTLVLRTPVRTEISRTVTVYNYSKAGPCIFQMETDIPNLLGPSNLTVPAATVPNKRALLNDPSVQVIPGKAEYTFTFTPTVGGEHMGQLMFTDPRGKYQWYAIEAHCESTSPSSRVAVSTTVRHAVAVDIDLTNPTDLEVALDVTISGEGLVGESVFVLGPGENRTYDLLYAPLFPTPDYDSPSGPVPMEAIVTFSAPSVGDLTYGLDLIALPAASVSLPDIHAPIGSTGSFTVTVENPTANEATVRTTVSNGRNYSLDLTTLTTSNSLAPNSNMILIPPFSSRKVPFLYNPSSLGKDIGESCIIHLSSTQIGDWDYEITGFGTPPEPASIQRVTATVNTTISAAVPFRNPFPVPLVITPSLSITSIPNDGSTDANGSRVLSREETGAGTDIAVPTLALLRPNNHHTSLTLAPFASVTIPFTFAPASIAETKALVTLIGQAIFPGNKPSIDGRNRPGPQQQRIELAWTFPIRAIGEAPVAKKTIVIKGTARAATTVPLSLPLANWKIPNHLYPSASGREFLVEIVPIVNEDDIAKAAAALSSTVHTQPTVTAAPVHRSILEGANKSRTAIEAIPETNPNPPLSMEVIRKEAEARLIADIARSITVVPKKTTLQAPTDEILLDVKVRGLKPMHCRAEIVVSPALGGGSWRFPLKVSITAAEPDDTLHIAAPINNTASLVFGLANAFPRPANFRAYFSLDSPGEFRVTPSTGVLPSSTAHLYVSASDGVYPPVDAPPTKTDISINFSPREYGHTYHGTLHVETDEMLWTFNVIGTLPKYQPPTINGATVDDHLSSKALATLRASQAAMNKRNMVAEYLHTYLPPHESAAGVLVAVHDPTHHGTANTTNNNNTGGTTAANAQKGQGGRRSSTFGVSHDYSWMGAGGRAVQDEAIVQQLQRSVKIAKGPGVPQVSPLRLHQSSTKQ